MSLTIARSATTDKYVNTLWLKICLCAVSPGGRGGGGRRRGGGGGSGSGRGGDCQHRTAQAAAGDREDLQDRGEDRAEGGAPANEAGHALLRRAAGRRLQEEL